MINEVCIAPFFYSKKKISFFVGIATSRVLMYFTSWKHEFLEFLWKQMERGVYWQEQPKFFRLQTINGCCTKKSSPKIIKTMVIF